MANRKSKTCPECREARIGAQAKMCRACRLRDRDGVVGVMGNPAWRPPHFPPPCLVCAGFGYARQGDGGTRGKCERCRGSGNACTWAEHRANIELDARHVAQLD